MRGATMYVTVIYFMVDMVLSRINLLEGVDVLRLRVMLALRDRPDVEQVVVAARSKIPAVWRPLEAGNLRKILP